MNGVVSWGELAVFLVVLLVFYYAVALLVLYRREWRALLRRRIGVSFPGMERDAPVETEAGAEVIGETVKKKDGASASSKEAISAESAEGAESPAAAGRDLVHDLLGEFAGSVRVAEAGAITRPDLELSLRELFGRYGALREHKLFDELVRHIVTELETKLSCTLSDAEVRALWGAGG